MSGGSDNASKQAQANEAARQANIANSTTAINNIFNSPSRTSAYDKLNADTTAYYQRQADQQQQKASRNLTFALARSGQSGGSVQADQGEQLGKDYANATLEAQRRGQAAGANLRAADETQRSNLIAAAQGGLDATTAAQNASSAMRANLETAQSGATANALGDAFGDFSNLYQQSQQAKNLRQGQLYAYNTVYQPGFGAGAGSAGAARSFY